ncbi:hypothetical protein [Rufibacter hautae]|uniref:Lipocalin-like domain-containing protein n=1 Tax=Rufibacter hautae TaxID=2595005 RepID=A0A5B6TFN5_9BACT|nr:hypothetical protein [Rufibacter hautae]KAA3439422.1 hypothetical protein FOA19_01670 [Rufibacter hautae]
MKNILYPLLFILLTMSCTPTDEISPEPDQNAYRPPTLVPSQVFGQWKLAKMIQRTQIAGQPDHSYPLPYEEILHLNPDSSVIRYRNGAKATGSFSIKTYPNITEWHVLIKLDDPSVAFHTFGNYNWGFGQGKGLWNGEAEYLLLDYSASDGPTAYYQKVTETK